MSRVKALLLILQPQQGWISLLLMIALHSTLAGAVRQTEWVNFNAGHLPLESASLASLLCLWLWLRPAEDSRPSRQRLWNWLAVGGALAAGSAFLLQLLTDYAGRWIRFRPTPSASLEQLAAELWRHLAQAGTASVSGLAARVEFWLSGVRGSGAQQDDLILIGLASFVLMGLAVQSTVMFLNGRSLLPVMLPTLALTAYILYFSRGSRLTLLAFMALLLAFHAWNEQKGLFAEWRSGGIDFSEGIMVDRAFAVLAAMLFMTVIAGVVPSIDFSSITEWVRETMRPVDAATSEYGERLFPELQSTAGGQDRRGGGGLPNSFLLGDSPTLSNQVALSVTTSVSFDENEGFYLRGKTYDQYDGKGWSNASPNPGEALAANTLLDRPSYPYVREVWQSVRPGIVSSTAFAMAEPVQFSVRVRPSDVLPGGASSYRKLERGSYSVLSAVPLLSDAVLRQVKWEDMLLAAEQGLETYLTLPSSITPRTQTLARDLTEGAASPYEAALALESHLRGLPYDLDVSLPADGIQDVADYFLFDLGRGYCDYYTTAFVVMARLNGMAARFATGYAPGFIEPYSDEWVVMESQAHSWPEVWFPSLGWIPFEPTAGLPALSRSFLPRGDIAPLELAASPTLEASEAPAVSVPWARAVLAVLIPILLVVAVILARKLGARDPWLSLLAWGTRLGRCKRGWETEQEYAGGLAVHLAARSSVSATDERAMSRQIHSVALVTVQYRYGRHALPKGEPHPAELQWRNLRQRLRRLYFRLP